MFRHFKSPWLGAGVLVFALATSAPAQFTAPPTRGATPGTTGTPGGSGTGGSTSTGGFAGLGSLFGSFGGFSQISPDQDAQLLATAVATVQMIGQLVPLSTGEELFLTFILYEFEKLNFIQSSLFGNGTTLTSPAGP